MGGAGGEGGADPSRMLGIVMKVLHMLTFLRSKHRGACYSLVEVILAATREYCCAPFSVCSRSFFSSCSMREDGRSVGRSEKTAGRSHLDITLKSSSTFPYQA